MDIKDWIIAMKPMMMSRAHKRMTDNLAGYVERNTLYSTAAFYTSVYIWYEAVMNEIEKVIERAALIKLRIKEWNVLNEILKCIVTEGYPAIIQEFKDKNFDINKYTENNSFLNGRIKREQEINAMVDVLTESQIQKIVKQRIEILWNLLYAFIGGIIGTAITLIFTNSQ